MGNMGWYDARTPSIGTFYCTAPPRVSVHDDLTSSKDRFPRSALGHRGIPIERVLSKRKLLYGHGVSIGRTLVELLH